MFIRSDWSKRWPDPKLATEEKFPGVKLDALKFLHLQRHILFHGPEALDTDTTPDLEGEAWLSQKWPSRCTGTTRRGCACGSEQPSTFLLQSRSPPHVLRVVREVHDHRSRSHPLLLSNPRPENFPAMNTRRFLPLLAILAALSLAGLSSAGLSSGSPGRRA